MSRRIQGVSNAQYGQGAIAQAAHDEHLVWVDQSGTSNVSNVKYANHTPAAGFQCKQCHSRFISQEMTVLHEQMEHAKTLLRYRSIGPAVKRPGGPRLQGLRSFCIYKQTAAVLANDIYEALIRNEAKHIAHSAYDSLLELDFLCRSTPSRVALLAKALPQRSRLIEASSGLPCRQGSLWEALEIDDRSLVAMLEEAIFREKGEVMELRNDAAASFLTLVDSVLYTSLFGQGIFLQQAGSQGPDAKPDAFKDQLHRISVRLSMVSFQLPESLFLTGVIIQNPKQVAAGGYADIHMGQYRGRLVALKTMRVFTQQTPKEISKSLKTICREVTLLHSLKHPNICELIGVDRELFGGRFCLVTDWMPYGNIMDFVGANSFVFDEVKQFVVEIASALEYLHSKNVVHGDLHVKNILIDAGRHVRLADFGLSDFSDASSASVSSGPTGAVRYMAPEILFPENYGLRHLRHTPESDVYSFSMCVWAVFSRDSPFHDYSIVIATLAIISGKRPPRDTANHEIPEVLWCLLTLCWKEQPKDRPISSDLHGRLCLMFQPPSPSDTDLETPTIGSRLPATVLSLRTPDSSGDKLMTSDQLESAKSKPSTFVNVRPSLLPSLSLWSKRPRSPPVSKVLRYSPLSSIARSSVDQHGTNPVAFTSLPGSPPPTVRNLASVFPGAERLIPQIIYRPTQTEQPDEDDAVSGPPIMFYVRGPQGCGINCSDALDEQFAELQGPNDVIQCPPAVVLRVLWPDHEPWSASVHLNPSPTRAQLAKLVSFHAQTFVAETWAKPVTTDTRWKLGPGALTVPDLELVGLQPVTSQDWQVHFRVQQVTG